MFGALAYVHGLVFRLCFWLLKQPFKALWVTLLGLLALLGEEVQRWAGLVVAWSLLVFGGRAAMHHAPGSIKRELALTLLVFVLLLMVATRRAAHITSANNTVKVRQRQAFKDLQENAAQAARGTQQGVVNTAAQKTRGTPAGRVFRQNRDADAAEAEQERLVAEQVEAERIATAEQAVRDQQAAAERERRLEELAAMEPSPYDD